MDIFQFIKYDHNTDLSSIQAKNKTNTILCFDLEDSIQDCINPERNSELKSQFRNILFSILEKQSFDKAGLRINACNTKDHLHDLSILNGKSIGNIFLPKTSKSEQVKQLRNTLRDQKTKIGNIIPVIETKNGMNQLEEIIDQCDFIKYIAFGHCDYNHDVGVFPFFHQDAKDYWDWVKFIHKKIKKKNIKFINSPLLQLENNSLFKEMLHRLSSIWEDNFGQITLSNKQSFLCSEFSKGDFTPKKIFPMSAKLCLNTFAKKVINSFERNNSDKGFSIDKYSNTIISPHEYFSVLSFLNKSELPEVNFTFMGGCFPVQSGVCFEDRFHQLLKRRIETQFPVRFNVDIIRYERLLDCSEKLAESSAVSPIQLLVFSIRPELVIRMTKLIYKFIDYEGKIRRSINFALLKLTSSEKFDLLLSDRLNNSERKKNKPLQYKLFFLVNLILGILAGNFNFSVKRYLSVTNEIISYCKNKNVKLLILGPPLKSSSLIESIISQIFANRIRILEKQLKGNFIDGTAVKLNNIELFDNSGIYANEHYHSYIADIIYDKMSRSNLLNTVDENQSIKDVILQP